MRIITRAVARRRGRGRYFPGTACKRGHVAERLVSTGACVLCGRAASLAWQRAHPEHVYRLTHPEQSRAYHRAYHVAHRAQVDAQQRAWRRANPDHVAAGWARQRARKEFPGCVPPDFNLAATIPFYAEARRRSRETGISYEVDHVRALCLGGLHVAANLQVLTHTANVKKGKADQAAARARRA